MLSPLLKRRETRENLFQFIPNPFNWATTCAAKIQESEVRSVEISVGCV